MSTPKKEPYEYIPGSAAPTGGSAVDYATWLQGHAKYTAEQERIKAHKQAETDRQRQILDANNAYQTGLASYGANAEKMASMGLSNSGYGEYLTGKAYATQRGDIQAANVNAQARKDQALYVEGQAKMAADAKYAEDLIGIKNQQNTDYGSLYDSALNGASIESLIQDARWGTLTDAQRATIRTATTQNSIKAMLDSGKKLDEIIADTNSGWSTLTVDQQNQLTTYYNGKTAEKNAIIGANFESYLTAIKNGSAALEDVMALPGWQDMVGTAYETQLRSAWDTVSEEKKENEKVEAETILNDTVLNKSQDEIDDAVSAGTLDKDIGDAAKDKQNKSAYNSIVGALNSGDNIGAAFADLETAYAHRYVDKPTYDEAKALLDSTPAGIAYQYDAQMISDKQFVEKMVAAGYGTSGTVNGGWYVQGLGSGIKNDDIDITIGGTERDKDKEYDLLCGAEVTDQNTVKALNAVATGDENTPPSTKGESLMGSSTVNSNDKAGKLVLYEGGLYLYTKQGWRTVENDNDKTALNRAIVAWMGGQNYTSVSRK